MGDINPLEFPPLQHGLQVVLHKYILVVEFTTIIKNVELIF